MTVYFIGAGPGAEDLITIRGAKILRSCLICLYAGSIIPPSLLALCPSNASIIDTGSLNLDQIIEEIVFNDYKGSDIARLHSGDTSIYSTLSEQCKRLTELNVKFTIVPGVPAFAAAAAVLGKELTIPGLAQTVILSRTANMSTPMPIGEDIATLSKSGTTLVLHLAAAQISKIAPQLIKGGYLPETPCVVVSFISWPNESIIQGTLSSIANKLSACLINKMATVIVGDILTAQGFSDSYLYSSSRFRGHIY